MTRERWSRAAAVMLALGVACALLPVLEDSREQQALPSAVAASALRPVAAFAAITDDRARAIALFQEAGKVIAHPRCMNCHPAGDSPTQPERMQPHLPLVVRGADGHGAPGMTCATCHHAANYDPAGVPGHPDWHLAPLSMGWQGRSVAQICEQIKDRARNGGRDMASLVQHMAEDSLVGWAWSPAPPPAATARRRETALEKSWGDFDDRILAAF